MGPSRLISPVGVVLLFLSPAYSAESALRFTKIFGGSGNESVSAMVTDPAGFVILAGQTSSYDFPVTDGSLNTGTQFAVTADSGLTWRPLSNLPSGTPTVTAVDSSTSPIWYAAGTTGIFKSTDGGATWQPTGSLGLPECNYVAPFCGVNKLVIHPTQPATLYAIVGARILKSTDAGASWNPLPAPFQNPNSPSSLALDPFHPDHLFTSIIGLDFRSFDGGQTWTRFTPPLVHPGDTCGSGFLTIAFDAVTPNIMYSAEHCDLYRSVDGGVNWDALQVPTRDVFGVVTDPKRAGLIYVPGGDGVYSSQDRGTTWKRLLP